MILEQRFGLKWLKNIKKTNGNQSKTAAKRPFRAAAWAGLVVQGSRQLVRAVEQAGGCEQTELPPVETSILGAFEPVPHLFFNDLQGF